MKMLQAYAWPGNVRELDHVVERAVLLSRGTRIQDADLSCRSVPGPEPRVDDLSLEDLERLFIDKALARHGGNVLRTARALGLSRSALYRRLQKYGLDRAGDAGA
jgi:DNA-binding NtrC family response regulator